VSVYVLQYGLPIDGVVLSHTDLHIHFPAGAVGKDGPSAGVTIAAALISLFSERPIAADVAMTGEITLRGVVLPVSKVPQTYVLSKWTRWMGFSAKCEFLKSESLK
jgi:ATP-dependent Lon protease